MKSENKTKEEERKNRHGVLQGDKTEKENGNAKKQGRHIRKEMKRLKG